MLLPQELFGMIASTLNLGVLFVQGQWADHMDAARRETVEILILYLDLCHQTRRGSNNVLAFAAAAADIFREDDLFAKTARLLARRAERDDLKAHVVCISSSSAGGGGLDTP